MSKKGIIFTFISSFLFASLILGASSVASRINNENKMIRQEIPLSIDAGIYYSLSSDIARIFGTKVINQKNLTIIEEMPKDITGRISDYETFINEVIKTATLTQKSETLHISNHTVITYASNKTWYNLTTNETLTYLKLDINTTSITQSVINDWEYASSGINTIITIRDALGNTEIINGITNNSRINTINFTGTDNKQIIIELKDHLLVNTTGIINTTLETNLKGSVYTGHEIRIINQALEMSKNYRTIVR